MLQLMVQLQHVEIVKQMDEIKNMERIEVEMETNELKEEFNAEEFNHNEEKGLETDDTSAEVCQENCPENVVNKEENKKLFFIEKANQYETRRNEIDERKADSEESFERRKITRK